MGLSNNPTFKFSKRGLSNWGLSSRGLSTRFYGSQVYKAQPNATCIPEEVGAPRTTGKRFPIAGGEAKDLHKTM